MRASRLLSILMLLQLRGSVSARLLAAEFEVSVRTIHRDIDELSASGVPIIATRGPHGGFTLGHGYQTKLTGLRMDEESAIVLAAVPESADALGMGAAAREAAMKIFASLGDGGVRASRLSARFHIDPLPWYQANVHTPALPTIARAVLEERVILTHYESWRGRKKKTIEPLGLVLKAGAWYLVANTTRGPSTFATSRMTELVVTQQAFTRPRNFDLAKFWKTSLESFEQKLRPGRATIRTDETGARRMCEWGEFARKAVAQATPWKSRWWTIDLPIESNTQASHQLMGLGTPFEVIAPRELRAEVRALAQGISRNHRVVA
jgi:predicted DNA-binding transcriptional regulator YafY